MLVNLNDLVNEFDRMPPTECFNDVHYYYQQIQSLFYHGVITMREKAYADEIYWFITRKALKRLHEEDEFIPDELQDLDAGMVDYYYGNFSIFQSLPDSWAMHQIFPVMPLHRLNERPTRKAVISDITCDCDGILNHFVSSEEAPQQSHLLLHPLLPKDDDYFLGVFLVGAYQETLGDLHNLLGDTNVVSVTIQNDEIQFETKVQGDRVAEVLSYLEYNPSELVSGFSEFAEASARTGRLTEEQRVQFLDAYKKTLAGYTYFTR